MMQTYIWADSMYPGTEYEFMAAVAEDLESAKEIMLKEIDRAFKMEGDDEDRKDREKVIRETVPLILKYNEGFIIQHANE